MRRFLGAMAVVLALAGGAEAQRVSPSGGVTGLTSWGCATTNRVPYMDAADTAACSQLERTSATSVRLIGANFTMFDGATNLFTLDVSNGHAQMQSLGQYKFMSTQDSLGGTADLGLRRDAAGSLSISNGSTGHATGLGLGTTTPKTPNGGSAFSDAAIQVTGGAVSSLIASGTTAGTLDLLDTNQTANQRWASIQSGAGTFGFYGYNDNAAVRATYLSINLATDVVTLGSASVTGVTVNSGTGAISLTGFTFANIGTRLAANGDIGYCSDCTIANPCAGGGTGAFAKRLNGVNVCN